MNAATDYNTGSFSKIKCSDLVELLAENRKQLLAYHRKLLLLKSIKAAPADITYLLSLRRKTEKTIFSIVEALESLNFDVNSAIH